MYFPSPNHFLFGILLESRSYISPRSEEMRSESQDGVQKLTEGSTYGGDGDEDEKRKKKDKTPPVSRNNPPPAFRSTKYPGTG